MLNSSLQPEPEATLSTLLRSGSYRHAAILAVRELSSPNLDPKDHTRIFRLLYVRLACLTLCGHTDIAATESCVLEDLGAKLYWTEDPRSGMKMHIVPWELRVLAVRLQALGWGDVRRGVVGYYDLAREARAFLSWLLEQRASLGLRSGDDCIETEADGGHDDSIVDSDPATLDHEIATWSARLSDLGIRVASALVEMDDLSGAARFLRTLSDSAPRVRMMRALLWLRIGDVAAARRCFRRSERSGGDMPRKGTAAVGDGVVADDDVEQDRHQDQYASQKRSQEREQDERDIKTIEALAQMADGAYETAAALWKDLIASMDKKRELRMSSPSPAAAGTALLPATAAPPPTHTSISDMAARASYTVNLAICELYKGPDTGATHLDGPGSRGGDDARAANPISSPTTSSFSSSPPPAAAAEVSNGLTRSINLLSQLTSPTFSSACSSASIDAHTFAGLAFNLCTLYELCSERASELKGALVETVVGRLEGMEGREGREVGKGRDGEIRGSGGEGGSRRRRDVAWERRKEEFKLA